MGILIIDDDKKVVDFMRRAFESEQHEVEVSADGEEGFRMALEATYDLILLDLVLPRKDGLSIVRDLRASAVTTPVLIVTAESSIDDVVAGLDAGSDDYMAKPFALAELLARVRALLRRSAQERGAEIRFSDLRLDPVTRTVWRGDTEVRLTTTEYALLEFFMRNPNRPLSRGAIFDTVWSHSEFDRFTNVVDVYINYLRKKIDRGAERKLIHTIHRTGYILREA